MSIDLNQALEYAVAWAKEVGKIECVRCGNKSR